MGVAAIGRAVLVRDEDESDGDDTKEEGREGDDAQHGRLRGLGGARHALGAANLQVDAAAEGEEHAEGKVVLRTLRQARRLHT